MAIDGVTRGSLDRFAVERAQPRPWGKDRLAALGDARVALEVHPD